jgi:large subunit ribosomal protein L7/L12
MADDKKTEADKDQKTEKPKNEDSEKDKAKAKAEAKTEAKEEKKPEVKLSAKLAKVVEEIEKLSVLELADLVKALEEKFGVSAAAMPMATGAPAAAEGGAAEGAKEEQTSFNVVLADAGGNKISVIKAVREVVPSLGLKDAKDLVESAPKPVLEGANKETANEAKTKLEAAGAKVELK